MNDIPITVVGTVLQDPKVNQVRSGAKVTSLRLASNSRRLNRSTGLWEDGETTFVTINCWRGLGENVAEAIKRGDPVVVTGRLKVREWSTEERNGISVEIEASSVGHDLSRGVSSFHKVKRTPETSAAVFSEQSDAEALLEVAREAEVSAALDPAVMATSGAPQVAEPPF